MAKDCRDPVRCFDRGSFGHKRFECSSKSIPITDKNMNLSTSDHGFLFVLKCTKLKRILLDHLRYQRSEGIDFLEYLYKHSNEVSIGSGYRKRFGDPEEYFGYSVEDNLPATDSLSNLNVVQEDSVFSSLVEDEDAFFF